MEIDMNNFRYWEHEKNVDQYKRVMEITLNNLSSKSTNRSSRYSNYN